jgi:two-component system nitrate/nitrite response regulator NarL
MGDGPWVESKRIGGEALKPVARPGRPDVRIILADEHSLFREAVRATLERDTDLVVVATAADATTALVEAGRHRPDVVVLTSTLPNGGGLHATATIRERVHETRIVFLGDDGDHSGLVEALLAGASGYLTKNCALPDLIQATRTVADGQTYIAPDMLGPLVEYMVRRGRQRQDNLRLIARLTPREREVLALLSSGGDNESIATALYISPQTARTHIQNVLTKLGLHSRLAAATFAMQEGVVEILNDFELGHPPSTRSTGTGARGRPRSVPPRLIGSAGLARAARG